MNLRPPVDHVNFTAKGSQQYCFRVLPPELAPVTPGIYAFIRIASVGNGISPPQITVGYIARASRIRHGLAGHRKLRDARTWGATHIAILELPRSSNDQRTSIERQLIDHFDPPLNR